MSIITIDGPAGAGKGTLGRALAKAFHFAYLDTGLLYRAVAKQCLDQPGLDPAQAAQHLSLIFDNPAALRQPEVGNRASEVAAIAAVRAALLQRQQDFAAHPPAGYSGVVLDGRDTGTVICPQAPIKFFLQADVAARAKRRFDELNNNNISITYDDVLADMQARDARDSEREAAPLTAAKDALIIDSSQKTVEQVFALAYDFASTRLGVHNQPTESI